MPLSRALLVLLAALAAAPVLRAQDQTLYGVPAGELTGLADPSGACFLADGTLVVAEARANRISRWSAEGAKLNDWGEDELSRPRGLACEGERVFVLDTGHGRVVAYDSSGRRLGTAGEPGHGAGQFHDARALALRGRDLLVADTGNDRLQLLRRTEGCGEEECFDFELRLSPYAQPRGAAFLPDGSLLVADTQADRLVRLDGESFEELPWGARGEAPGLFSRPTGLAVAEGLIYSVDTENHRVQVFDSGGEHLGGWGRHAWLPHEGEGKLHYPEVVAIDAARGIAAVCEPFEDRCQLFTRGPQPPDPKRDRLRRNPDRSSHYGRRMTMSGRLIALTEMDGTSVSLMDLPREQPLLIHRIGRPGTGHGLFRDAVAALIDGEERVIVADSGARRIATFAHDHDLDEPETRFDHRLSRLVREIDLEKVKTEPRIRPVALAKSGDELFVLDDAGSRVVVLDRDGTPLREFGGFGEEPGRFRFPTELAFDGSGRQLFVVDSGNARIQVFDRNGKLLRHWGEGELVEPFGACVAPDGAVFVTDRASNRVLRFNAAGGLERAWGDAANELPAAERMGAGQLHRPTAVALSGAGELIVIDHGHHRGQIFTPEGEYLRAFGARLYTRPTRGASPGGGDEN